jgi:hypothetical protein
MTFKRLTDVRTALQQKVPLSSFAFINTRLMLKTGISLSTIPDGRDADPGAIQTVVTTLSTMGYALHP